MSVERDLGRERLRRYPLHSRAIDRHAVWARDFAAAGALAAAADELRDIAAIVTELRDAEPSEKPV